MLKCLLWHCIIQKDVLCVNQSRYRSDAMATPLSRESRRQLWPFWVSLGWWPPSRVCPHQFQQNSPWWSGQQYCHEGGREGRREGEKREEKGNEEREREGGKERGRKRGTKRGRGRGESEKEKKKIRKGKRRLMLVVWIQEHVMDMQTFVHATNGVREICRTFWGCAGSRMQRYPVAREEWDRDLMWAAAVVKRRTNRVNRQAMYIK